jgi:hypothetical protein
MTAYINAKVFQDGNLSGRSAAFLASSKSKDDSKFQNSIFLDKSYTPMKGDEYESKLKNLLKHRDETALRTKTRSLEKDIVSWIWRLIIWMVVEAQIKVGFEP